MAIAEMFELRRNRYRPAWICRANELELIPGVGAADRGERHGIVGLDALYEPK
jgi:hypothetical protein